jgi:2-polyprenyl-3-methyl-5-hydroxy-6-metoxy-1,4-benzoquinol methylase
MTKSKYDIENELLPHYESHLKYYSPIKSDEYLDHVKNVTGLAINDSHKILDLGCGDGELTRYIGGAQYIGVDYSSKRIDLARNLHNKTNVNFINECARKYITSTDKQFDLIFAFEFLEHIVKPRELIDCVMKNQKNVTMIATVPKNLPRPVHLSVWETEQEVQRDLNPDFIQLDNIKRHFICLWKSQ